MQRKKVCKKEKQHFFFKNLQNIQLYVGGSFLLSLKSDMALAYTILINS